MNRSRVTGDLASQGNIFADIANDRVGIGSTIPTQKLDVTGTVIATTFSGSGASLTNLNGSNIASGTVPVARIGTGTKNTSTFYRGDGTFQVVNTDLSADTSPELGANLSTNGNFIQFPDSTTGNQNKAVFGGGLDLQIYHDGSHSYIHDGGTGNLKLRSNNFRVSNADESKISATFVPAGAVELYYNNAKQLETLTNGIKPTNNLFMNDDKPIYFGTHLDLQAYHDGSHSFLDHNGTGNLYIRTLGTDEDLTIQAQNDVFIKCANGEDGIRIVGDGEVKAYHNGNEKFATTSSGVDVTGTVTADNQIVLNSGDSTPARIDLYCEVSNAHYTRLQAPAHSTYSGNVTVTIPNTSGNLAVLANAANNRIVTATGTHAMTGETNFTYDGSNVINTISGTGGYKISTTSNVAPQIIGDANRSAQRNTLLSVNGYWNGTHVTMIDFQAGADTTNKDDGQLAFYTRTSGGSLSQRSLINSTGQTLIGVAGNGTEAGDNTKLCVRGTGTPGSGPSTIQNNTVATFRMTGSAAHAASIAVLAGNEGSSAVHFGDTDNDIIGRILYNHTSSNTSDYFEFFLQGSRRFRIQGNGNLCIGNDSNFTAGAKVEIRDTIGGGGGTGLILNDIGSSGANEGLHIEWRSGSDKQADQCRIGQAANATGSGSNFFIATNSADSGSSTERLRIDHNGDLGLGVTPDNFGSFRTLHIKGPSNNGAAIRLQYHTDVVDSNDFIIYKHDSAAYLRVQGTDPLIAYMNGGERFRIASSGQIGLSGANYGSSGQVLTSQGSGSAATWTTISGTTINSNTNNYLITGTGTANTLQGESGLTWTGSVFQLTSSGGNQFPFNVRNDFTPNSQRAEFAYFANSTSNNALRLGSINSNGGVTIQATRMNNSAVKHNLILNPDSGVVLISGTNSTTHSNVDQLIIGGTSGTNGITIKSGTTSFGCLYFHDEDTTNAPFGQIEYQHGTEQMSFYANQKLMMRIDGDEDEGQLRFTPNVNFSGTRNTNIVRETFILNTSESSNQAYHDNHHMSFGQTSGNWDEGTGGSDTSWGLMWHYSANASATRQCRAGIAFDHKGTEQFKIWSAYGDIVFYQDLANGGSETAETCDTECARFDTNGHFVPGANNGRDLGTTAKKWRNIYVMDMHFSNEGGSPNSVDGTTGNWTLQEGADGIYMINNKNGKKYEMMLKEVQ